MKSSRNRSGRVLCLILVTGLAAAASSAKTLNLHTRARVPSAADTNEWQDIEKTTAWEAKRTAIVVCDMWDKHWCPDATARVSEMAPRMNEVIKAARAKGVFIIHCPSDTMKFYEGQPGLWRAPPAP